MGLHLPVEQRRCCVAILCVGADDGFVRVLANAPVRRSHVQVECGVVEFHLVAVLVTNLGELNVGVGEKIVGIARRIADLPRPCEQFLFTRRENVLLLTIQIVEEVIVHRQLGVLLHPAADLLESDRLQFGDSPGGLGAVVDEERDYALLHRLIRADARVLIGQQRRIDIDALEPRLQLLAELHRRQQLFRPLAQRSLERLRLFAEFLDGLEFLLPRLVAGENRLRRPEVLLVDLAPLRHGLVLCRRSVGGRQNQTKHKHSSPITHSFQHLHVHPFRCESKAVDCLRGVAEPRGGRCVRALHRSEKIIGGQACGVVQPPHRPPTCLNEGRPTHSRPRRLQRIAFWTYAACDDVPTAERAAGNRRHSRAGRDCPAGS